jgi:ABC-2 type transport system ATP-binding protein
MNDVAIKVDNVSKIFKLPHEKNSSLKSTVINFHKRGYESQQALKDVSFEVKKGEFFGIVGRNGSGKSTMLKVLAGIYNPTEGRIQINGSLTPFIELGVGFNKELSGRENIFLNGALLGFSRKQIKSMYKDIVEFAELEKFMDQKLKNYSSGMQVRLAFSIAIRAQGQILLLDEVLAVGDAAFQQKCNDYFTGLKRGKQTIILVSHNMDSIEKYCERALFLEAGEVVAIGESANIAGMYEDMILKEEAEKSSAKSADETSVSRAAVETAITVYQDNKKARSVEAFKKFQIELSLKSKKDIPEAFAGVSIKNSESQIVLALDTIDYIGTTSLKKNKETKIRITVDNIFTNGTYYLSLALTDGSRSSGDQLFKRRNIASFTIFGVRKNENSLVHPHCEVAQVKD